MDLQYQIALMYAIRSQYKRHVVRRFRRRRKYVRAREPLTADEDDHTKINAWVLMGLRMAAFGRRCSARKPLEPI